MHSILYHDNCSDGLASAAVMKIALDVMKEPYELIPVNYDAPVPEVKGDVICILDFCYSPEETAKLALGKRELIVLDHHKKAADMFDGYGQVTNYASGCLTHIDICEDMSGAGMTYKYLMSYGGPSIEKVLGSQRIQTLVEAVQDRDLWRFALPDSRVIHQMLLDLPKDAGAWGEFMLGDDETYQTAFGKAKVELEATQLIVKDIAAKAILVPFRGKLIPMTECPGKYASYVGEILNKDHEFSLTYFIREADVLQCSLRSADNGADVNEIAKKFGGGGHIHAAGFTLRVHELKTLLNGLM